ncbi:MAG: ureidoglycolate hydrolase [Methylibium sp.]|nr:ureidoglycolate hydrolase [Methylibium sp.]
MTKKTTPMPFTLQARPLTPETFAPFGQVLQAGPPPSGEAGQAINSGTSRRHVLVGDLQLGADQGRGELSLSRAQARLFPLRLQELERHLLSTQSFIPLGGPRRLALVVARPGPGPDTPEQLQAFVSDGWQGVCLHAGTWHHPLLAVDAGDFLVIERRAAEVDCEVLALHDVWLALPGAI